MFEVNLRSYEIGVSDAIDYAEAKFVNNCTRGGSEHESHWLINW